MSGPPRLPGWMDLVSASPTVTTLPCFSSKVSTFLSLNFTLRSLVWVEEGGTRSCQFCLSRDGDPSDPSGGLRSHSVGARCLKGQGSYHFHWLEVVGVHEPVDREQELGHSLRSWDSHMSTLTPRLRSSGFRERMLPSLSGTLCPEGLLTRTTELLSPCPKGRT